MPAAIGASERPWRRSPEEVLADLGTSEQGLSEDEAERRLAKVGPNELEEHRAIGPFVLLLRQFRSPLIYILLVAAAVTLVLEEHIDAAVIAAVLVVNAAIGFTQELRAERSMEALRMLARARTYVVRKGREREVDARELVPGDIVILEAGSKVPADCRVVHAAGLETDESLLTGESVTVAKTAVALTEDVPVAERRNMVFMGSIVTRGRCRAAVTATSAQTELGRIAGSVQEIGEVETPLQRRMGRFARVVGVAVLVASALGLALGLAAGDSLDELFLAVVALAVSAIPEGLPIVLTLVLAVSVRRMAARHAIIRRLPAVETLGSCTVIGSDKTGTLTQNRMTVRLVHAGGRDYELTGLGYEAGGAILLDGAPVAVEHGSPLELALRAAVLCNDASAVPADGEFDVLGDPTEIALVVAAAKAGLFKDELEERYTRVGEIPFDSERRYAATFNQGEDGLLVLVKGAPEEVLAMSADAAGVSRLRPEEVLARAGAMAADGQRVLAAACRRLPDGEPVDAEVAHTHLEGLRFLGLFGMIDPPRAEAKAAVAGCQRAGIRVVMITGDHAETARAVARELGVVGPGARVLSGEELDGVADEELQVLSDEVSVFARVSPHHKLRIVTALRERGHTVAVTGDGVNDAPALKAADIGVAMGRSGTDVAKEASDMVVTDDNFASIFAAVEEGRIAFDNVRKATFFLISTGAAEIAAVLASIAFRFQLPFLPAQLLWLNLVTNGVQDVALAFEPGEKDVLRRPPRPRREGVISRLLWERTVIAGLVMAAGTLTLFLVELELHDSSIERARAVALTTMVLFQVFHVGNSRSERLSAFAKSPVSNRFLFVGTALSLALHVTALHVGFGQYVLRVEPLEVGTWLRMVAVASSVVVAVELHKLLRRGEGRLTGPSAQSPLAT